MSDFLCDFSPKPQPAEKDLQEFGETLDDFGIIQVKEKITKASNKTRGFALAGARSFFD